MQVAQVKRGAVVDRVVFTDSVVVAVCDGSVVETWPTDRASAERSAVAIAAARR